MRMGIGIEKFLKMTIPIQFKRVLKPFLFKQKFTLQKCI